MSNNINQKRAIGNPLGMFILDVLRHDMIEQVTSIVKMLNDDGGIGWRDCWPDDFTEQEVVPILESLVCDGFVQVLREQEGGNEVVPISLSESRIRMGDDTLWFSLTDEGRRLWSSWEPPKTYP